MRIRDRKRPRGEISETAMAQIVMPIPRAERLLMNTKIF